MRGVFHVKHEAGRRPPAVEVDVAVAWKGEPLLRRRVREGDTAWVGDVEGSWVRIPCGPIGVEGFRLARVKRGEALVNVPRGARGRLERPDGTVELFGSGREVWLMPGDLIRMGIGTFSITVTGVAGSASRAASVGRDVRSLVERFPGGQLGLSVVFHVTLLLVALLWPAREEQAAVPQVASLTEAEVAALLDVGPDGPGAWRPDMGPEASGVRGGEVERGAAAAADRAAARPVVRGEPVGGWVLVGPAPGEAIAHAVPVPPSGGVGAEKGSEPAASSKQTGSGQPVTSPEASSSWERARDARRPVGVPEGSGEERARTIVANEGAKGGSAPWGWMAGGALALAGLGAVRWRRSRRGGGGRPWSWTGALELGRLVTGGARVGLVGLVRQEVATGPAETGSGGDGLEVTEVGVGPGKGAGEATFDVVGMGEEAAWQDERLGLGWRAVRVGGLLVVCAGGRRPAIASGHRGPGELDGGGGEASRAAPAVGGRTLAERVAEGTGAAVVWWFEQTTGAAGEGLRTVVIAAKGRPARGPSEVLEMSARGAAVGAGAAAIAAGFRGWAPFGAEGAALDADEESLAG